MKISLSLVVALFCTACGQREHLASEAPAGNTADLVFRNGGIYTVNESQPWAEAAAIADGAILYVGDNAGVERWIGPETREVDLAGKMLLPGFHDSHVHLLTGGGHQMECNVFGLESMEETFAKLRECAAEPGEGAEGWILGRGWDRMVFPGGKPRKEMLDEIFGDRPVSLEALDGHSYWVSSRTLVLLGIDRDTPDPQHGVIDRDPVTGEATGVLDERAMELVDRIAPERSLQWRIRGLEIGMQMAHGFGITSVIDPAISDTQARAYAALSRRGDLKLRTLLSISPIGGTPGAFDDSVYDMVARRDQYEGPNLRTDSVKFFIDGVLENGTALLVDPYLREGDDHSHPYYPARTLREHFRRLDAAGIQIHAHAIGDQAVRSALDAFEAMRQANGHSGNRHHIVHLQLIHRDDVARFGELDITANFQALWAYPDSWIRELNTPMVGQERVDRMYPIGSVHRTGGRIVGGSDWFVSSLNPLEAIEVAVRRQDPDETDGPILNAEERVDLATMLAAYTINGAYLMSQEQTVGSIEVGKRADLVVLDRNLFEVPATEINQARVVMTLFDGRQVHPPAAD